MPTFSIKTPTTIEKENVAEFFKDVKQNRNLPDNWGVLKLLQQLYFEGIESLGPQESESVEQTLKENHCPYFHFEDWEFKCFEKKKPLVLGSDPVHVKVRCETCKTRKAESILQQYQKKLRGQNIKGILQMVKQFQTFAEAGVPTTIHFCNRIPGSQVMTGKKDILCSKHGSRVPINPTCIDPKCRHYETYTIRVEQEFPKQALKLIEGIAEDFKQIEDLTPTTPKDVESKQVKQE